MTPEMIHLPLLARSLAGAAGRVGIWKLSLPEIGLE